MFNFLVWALLLILINTLYILHDQNQVGRKVCSMTWLAGVVCGKIAFSSQSVVAVMYQDGVYLKLIGSLHNSYVD